MNKNKNFSTALIFFITIFCTGYSNTNKFKKYFQKGFLISKGKAPVYSAKHDSLKSEVYLSSYTGGPDDLYTGRLTLKTGVLIPQHSHPCSEVLMVESGSGKLTIEDTVYLLKKDDIVFLVSSGGGMAMAVSAIRWAYNS